MAKWAEQYGPVVKLQFLELFTVMVTDPAIIARITRKTGTIPAWNATLCVALLLACALKMILQRRRNPA